ncbi:hypothetical protein [Spirosoma validum]|uniref:Uncharacterized protein n=1 Tax=Spirosoma validum TaxID=2771355 RepID=A0A927GF44_9BACT|nr:hypothetical protein [Spirosoma validum]MBD2755454.1 hypothetical protein [Spirosoma validum]
MRPALPLFFLLITLLSCHNDRVSVVVTPCTYSDPDMRRRNGLHKAIPAIILTVGNQPGNYQLLPATGYNPVPLGPCNLPQSFQKDSLSVYVSGYFLTSPFLETANVSPLPFELTEISVRH